MKDVSVISPLNTWEKPPMQPNITEQTRQLEWDYLLPKLHQCSNSFGITPEAILCLPASTSLARDSIKPPTCQMLLKINAVSRPHVLLPTEEAPEGWALFPLRGQRLTCQAWGHGEQSHNCVGTPVPEQSQQNTSSPYQRVGHQCSWEG